MRVTRTLLTVHHGLQGHGLIAAAAADSSVDATVAPPESRDGREPSSSSSGHSSPDNEEEGFSAGKPGARVSEAPTLMTREGADGAPQQSDRVRSVGL